MKLFHNPTHAHSLVLVLFVSFSWLSITASADKKEVLQNLRLEAVNPTSLFQRELQSTDWEQIGSDIIGEATNDGFGHSVAFSADGTTIAIGAIYNDGNGSNSGHVRVYKKDGSVQWVQVGDDIGGEAIDDQSGYSVAISADGSTIAIGSPFNMNAKGHVRVYYNDGSGVWQQVWNDIAGDTAGDKFGSSVAISADGSTVAIGANLNDANGISSGHVRVYYSDGSDEWQQLGNDIAGEAMGDESGSSVALSADGTTIAIGAKSNDGNGITAGHVRVYKKDVSGQWAQEGDDIDGEAAGDQSGYSVALSADGTTIVIGAPTNGDNGINSGHVRVYEKNDGSVQWVQVGDDIDGEAAHDRSGRSVAISADGKTVAIGSPFNMNYIGHVRVYYNDGSGEWQQLGNDIEGEDDYDDDMDMYADTFGHSVALSADGRTIAVGSPSHYMNGKVTVYSFPTPSASPSNSPSALTSAAPSVGPSSLPSTKPSAKPSVTPSSLPSAAPSSITGVSGDPHFKSWAGTAYDFHGICDLMLLKASKFGNDIGLEIHIRTKKIHNWSYVSSVSVRIGDNNIEVEGGSENKIWMNGERQSSTPSSISGFPITFDEDLKKRNFIIHLSFGAQIHIKTWHAYVSVNINPGTSEEFKSSVGMMGTFPDGIKVGRDNVTQFYDINAFGQEWQVLPTEPKLFHNTEGPQSPKRCEIPSASQLRRRLSKGYVTKADAEKSCDRVSEKEDFDLCVFDVLATNDKNIANAY